MGSDTRDAGCGLLKKWANILAMKETPMGPDARDAGQRGGERHAS